MRQLTKRALRAIALTQGISDWDAQPPLRGRQPESERVIDSDLLSNTKSYMQSVARQINGTYENGWYDACAVMLRRFVETLIIETYIAKGIESNIKDGSGNFFALQNLIDKATSGSDLNLSRDTKKILRKLKTLGDRSAHGRTFVANRNYFDQLFEHLYLDMQTVIQDFLNEAGIQQSP